MFRSRVCTIGLATLALGLILRAQNVDTVITEDTRSFRIIDQIEDPEERSAFVDLYGSLQADQRIEKEPGRMSWSPYRQLNLLVGRRIMPG